MTRLGVYGGSFDPPHRTHERVARAALDQLQLNAVLWIPAAHPPHKPGQILSADHHRLAMIHGIIAHEPRFQVDTRELDRGGTSWTIRTLESLTTDHPDAELFLILGSDNLAGFERWKEPDRIANLAKLVVYDRPGHGTEGVDPDGSGSGTARPERPERPARSALHLDGVRSAISSTAIRRALRNGGATPGTPEHDLLLTHLHPRTLSYIRAHELYLPI